jgi:hypothetical protein
MKFWRWYWRVVLGLAILFVLAFALFIWPTPWRHVGVYTLNYGEASAAWRQRLGTVGAF